MSARSRSTKAPRVPTTPATLASTSILPYFFITVSTTLRQSSAEETSAFRKVTSPSFSDLADLKIGVQTGTTGDSQASDAVNADSQMQRYNKGADAIQALKNGKIDCVVIDSLPAEKFVAANDDLKIVEGIFDTEEYAMCFKKGNELRDEFNTALAELKEDGTLDEIMSNYI